MSTTPVSVISVTGNNTVINGETLQLIAAVIPTNATDKRITWSVINGTGTATINTNGLLTATGVGSVTVKATNVVSGIVGSIVITVEPTLAEVKATAKADLATALLTYTVGDYTGANWITLTTAKTNGDAAIDGATDLVGVGNAKKVAINAMDAVKTIAETAAEALAAAIAAINNADAADMADVITANAVILGLDLTNYNALADKGTVITAMVALNEANKATILSVFNAAVETQKTAEALAAAKATAKSDLAKALLTYTVGDYTGANWITL
ncbi:MAG: Ig-like domain-containing protein, partial [Clostridium sp.]